MSEPTPVQTPFTSSSRRGKKVRFPRSVFVMLWINLTLAGTVGQGFVLYCRRPQWQVIGRLTDQQNYRKLN